MVKRGVLVLVLLLPLAARADEWHAGLNLRADSGAHPLRVGGGVEVGAFDIAAALDPMVVFDQQFDADLFAVWRFGGHGWGVLGGWRTSIIGIAGGQQYQEKLLVGLSGALPQISDSLRAHWGFELATVIVKHGGNLPTDWISFASGRDFIDLINFGMFVTFEYAGTR